MTSFAVPTARRDQMVEITQSVQAAVDESSIPGGLVVVHVPHTTAGITINENADPDVVHDFLRQLDEMVPWHQPFYRHGEGNSAAHVKASMMGASLTVMIQRGRLVLGRWQGIWLCEFDGPRTREVQVKIMADRD
ncbi:MAG: secondary thiamine-phosphate synthase enzyme YjbQ [Phycisphaerae bacterium]|nr:secondary thiamine-phosphate synthase enzyme YjbQ [Phycisphaerae bacterium]